MVDSGRDASRNALLWVFELRSVPNGIDGDPPASDLIKDDIGRAADHQLTDSWFISDAAKMRMMFQGIDDGDDPDDQPFSRIRLALSDVSANVAQAREREGRPDNL